ncbi:MULTISPECIES: hypothetical protein [Anaerococcus]|uniref:Uncharacterized protein n=2 Tax=Anaerococcus TaxID=165779 RepID=A0A3E2TKR5_9FIRM|nr:MULTISPECIES: hypothetical protein [Anaerococcus]PKZ17295.1 hypothetical protein CYJ34_00885 [Anaerococcus octavius]RGB77968.1 hypothetical protein DXA39_00530 [Anaerococcus nagyae]SUU92973.1 Replication initiation factor [Anaerococcus octavius]
MEDTNKLNLYDKIVRDNKNKKYPKNPSKLSDISVQFDAETIYLGSRKRKSNALFRMYDKKKEQLS